jgi:cellobiose epimerase
MDDHALTLDLRRRVESNLTENILPFWIKYTVDREHGGFYGTVTDDLQVIKDAPRALVICGRILWTFSAAYRMYSKPEYLEMADWAYAYLTERFWDHEYGGFYWQLDHLGNPAPGPKLVYGQAFALYGLAEYYQATHRPEALERAQAMYQLIEKHCYDPQNLGYFEAMGRDWSLLAEQRLSKKDLMAPKSQNTLLHLFEAYTNLLRAWDDAGLRKQLTSLVNVFLGHIIDPQTYHLRLFFSADWHSLMDHISYGHDIEASWLLTDTAEVLADPALLARVKDVAVKIAQAIYERGLDPDGSLLYEASPRGLVNTDKHWWPQAEALVGFYNAYQLSGQEHFLQAALRCWEYIDTHMVDHKSGEWFATLKRDGSHYPAGASSEHVKAGFWKCPYHNGRACMEIMRRVA